MLYFAGYDVQLMNLHVHVLQSFFYTLNIVFCPICSIVESPLWYITFITYFVCCISRVLAWSFGKYICITLFIMSYVTGRVHWNNTYVLQSLFTLNDIFYQTFSIKVSPSIRLSLRLQCFLCFKKHGKKEIYLCQRISLLSRCILHRIIRKSDWMHNFDFPLPFSYLSVIFQ